MVHPEVFVVPALMLSDYYLTLAGAALFANTPEKRAAYELNPLWRNDIAHLRLVNIRHLVCVAVLSSGLIYLTEEDSQLATGVFAFAVGMLGVLVGGHITNILTLLHGRKLTDPVTGRFPLTTRFNTMSAGYRYIGSAFPFALVVLFHGDAFNTFVLAGVLGLAAVHFYWSLKTDRTAPITTVATRPELICAFCGLDKYKVPMLIVGKTAAICGTCVEICTMAVDEKKADERVVEPASAPLGHPGAEAMASN